MAKNKSGMTEDEKLTVEEVIGAFEHLGEFIDDEENELPSITKLGFDAQVKLLKGIHTALGTERIDELIEILKMANDADFRCPK